MPIGDHKPGQLRECSLCHRVGYAQFAPCGSEEWVCSNDRACNRRIRSVVAAVSGTTPEDPA